MSDKEFDIVMPQHGEISDRIIDDFKRGVTRRDAMRTLLAGGMLASTAGGLLTHAGTAFAAPRRRAAASALPWVPPPPRTRSIRPRVAASSTMCATSCSTMA